MLEAILAHLKAEQWPPTHRELADRCGFSTSGNATHELLSKLERDGLLERERGKARAMRVTAAGHAALRDFRKTTRDRPIAP